MTKRAQLHLLLSMADTSTLLFDQNGAPYYDAPQLALNINCSQAKVMFPVGASESDLPTDAELPNPAIYRRNYVR